MDRRGFLVAGGATIAGLSGCLGVVAEGNFDVGMTSNAFVPRESIAVPDHAPDWVPRGVPTHRATVGERVVWENTGSRNHTVTAATSVHGTAEDILGIEHVHGERRAGHDDAGGHDGTGQTATPTDDGHDTHSHSTEPTTTTDGGHDDHDHSHGHTTTAAGPSATANSEYRLPAEGTFFASGGFESEVAAVRSFVERLGGGGPILPGEQFVHTFEVPGWYHYYCIPHLAAGMVATVHVEA